MATKARVLCVDDDPDHCEIMKLSLEELGHIATATTSPLHALDLLVLDSFDVVLTDLTMDEMNGLVFCERSIGSQPHVPVVVLTGQGSMESVIAAMRAGAFDFLTKPIERHLLEISVQRATAHRRLRSEIQHLQQVVSTSVPVNGILGDSLGLRRVRDLVARVGVSDASVLICGETGTGKELVARAVHATSAHKEGAFVALNCAAVPAELLESELFGHVKGAFTDARTKRRGLFVEATGGTLFLDEIGEMSIEMQSKLLRALQERRVRPVGSDTEVAFDARIVAATHRDLEADVQSGRFRQDLFYRINVVRIDVPPLRERRLDVVKLAAHFLDTATRRSGKAMMVLTPDVAERLIAYEWPGNVRELENCIEGAVALARSPCLAIDDLPERIRTYRPEKFAISAETSDQIVSLQMLEQRYIIRVIKLLGGNKARTAQMLGLDRRTLYRKLERYQQGTDVPTPEDDPRSM